MDMSTTAQAPAGRFLALSLLLLGIASIGLGSTGLRTMKQVQQGRWIGERPAGVQSQTEQLKRWTYLIYAGGGLSVMSLVVGGARGRQSHVEAESIDDPDFAEAV
ncbi:MAG: hypothetical protein QOF78_3231 [Phycisphaerales bacterium]|jgi:hypothetical protein|nr:hypothetical protein [Phycisphaerales bacterium]